MDAICKGILGTKIIEISDKIADVICDQSVMELECAYVGRESEIDSAEPKALCCDGSIIMNCSEVTERVVPIQTAQGGTVMSTECVEHTSVSRHFLFEIEQVN